MDPHGEWPLVGVPPGSRNRATASFPSERLRRLRRDLSATRAKVCRARFSRCALYGSSTTRRRIGSRTPAMPAVAPFKHFESKLAQSMPRLRRALTAGKHLGSGPTLRSPPPLQMASGLFCALRCAKNLFAERNERSPNTGLTESILVCQKLNFSAHL